MTNDLDDLDFGEMPAPPNLKDDLAPIHGLVDGVRAASILRLPNANRVSIWLAKKAKLLREGSELTPLLAKLPGPVGYLGGSAVFTEQAIVDFGIATGFIEPGTHELTGEWIAAAAPAKPDALDDYFSPADDELF
ncbi:hypothetical protein [Arthrobacter sp. STN4]|uniref:hypothetical protein n=1 Tax=Arthrobacter sp. STN4 TaxID=2923276 RepID=UPI00211A34E2|nr:hypothetical protein [Arthrobacter sp. STN4]MCQ9162967.1 hypothetical protein [Arthrobacter sp. STN4]